MMNRKPRILIFASGSATGGGSGFAKMVELSRGTDPVLDADIVGVVSNHGGGGVAVKASSLRVPFGHWTGPFTAEGYRQWVRAFEADYVMLSGWLKKVSGLEMSRTVNIHPGPLPLTRGLYGHHVHEAVLAAYLRGEIDTSAVTMHFVDEQYDTGPVAFTAEVMILPEDTAEMLGARVNACEHAWQSLVLNLIVHGDIRLVGREVISSVGSLHSYL
ncbi:MAG: hypothetical protein KBA91_03575 [Candidatus Moranbacteria bacterium]|nr:hypothetical protein [Candidatus Moranbacteria bacterium]